MEIHKAAIFGANGVTGRYLTRELLARGVPIRLVARSEQALREISGSDKVEIHAADLGENSAATRAAAGCDVIFHCVGLPYAEFRNHPIIAQKTAIAMHDTGARCVLLSSYYAYWPIAGPGIKEDDPRLPVAFKARIRKQQEDILQDAGAAVTLLPDFYGPNAERTLIYMVCRDLVAGRKANWIGGHDVERQYVYVPDAASAIVELATRETAYGERWNVAGPGGITARQLFSIIERVLGKDARIRNAGQRTLRVLGLFSPLLRELVELYPLYNSPLVLDTSKLRGLIGPYRVTSYEEGLRETIEWVRATTPMLAETAA
jgi:nucleoside-diphosphate-sugar epimerase